MPARQEPAMNARLALAILPFVVIAACSDEPDPVVSGGAQFTLQNATKADIGTEMLGSCPDIGQQQTVAQRDGEGNLKLVVDGADDARVSCRYDGGRYNVSVSRATASFSASGTFKTMAECGAAATEAYGTNVPTNIVACSLDAIVGAASAANFYQTRDRKCSIFFTLNSDKKLRGTIRCPLLPHKSLANACALSPIGDEKTASFFSFANCSGF
jgi:hypothetical protein